ncbi:protein ergic-53, partial [Lasius niger]
MICAPIVAEIPCVRPIGGCQPASALAASSRSTTTDDRRGRGAPSSTVAMKMAAEVRWLLAFLVSCVVPFSRGEMPHRKFEYKYSFKPPYLAQKDGSVPFWEYGGNTIASAENVRVAPSLKSQK